MTDIALREALDLDGPGGHHNRWQGRAVGRISGHPAPQNEHDPAARLQFEGRDHMHPCHPAASAVIDVDRRLREQPSLGESLAALKGF